MTVKNLPAGWVETNVSSLCDVFGGGTPSTQNREYWEGPIPWISSADIYAINDIRPRRSISAEALRNSAANLVPGGSIVVVTRVGLGKVALVKDALCFSQDSQGLVFDNRCIYDLYLAYYLSEAVQVFKYEARGTTISGVTKKQLRELPVLLPPLPEQHRIVAAIEQHLTRLAAAVTALKRAQANLQRYRASLLKTACEGKLVPTEAALAHAEGRNYEHASQLLARILVERRARWAAQPKRRGRYKEPSPPDTSALPQLPEGWAWTSLSSIGEVRLGRQRSPKRATGPNMRPYLRAANVTWAGIDLSDVKEMDFDSNEFEVYRLLRGDILLAEASGSADEVGKPAIWDSQIDGCCFQNTLIRVRVFPEIVSYLYHHLLFDAQSGAFGRAARGVGIHHLGARRAESWIVALPPLDEQRRIVAEVERRLSVVHQAETAVETILKRAERLRQSILKRAFSGQLVPQDPNDEPAAVLLARIQAERAAAEATAKAQRKPRRRRPRRTPARQLSLAEGTP